jgi:hypothetical protein
VKRTEINLGIEVSVLYIDLHSFGYMPKSGMAGSKVKYIYSVLRKLYADFHSGSTSLRSYQKFMRVPFSLTSFIGGWGKERIMRVKRMEECCICTCDHRIVKSTKRCLKKGREVKTENVKNEVNLLKVHCMCIWNHHNEIHLYY